MKISEIKVSYTSKVNLNDAPQVTSSSDAAKVLFQTWDKGTIELQETFKILLLNKANKVKGAATISCGSIDGTVVDAKAVFSVALKTVSPAIILCHNHPSGSLMASTADIRISKKLKTAGEYLDVVVLDHIILSPNGGYYSLADNGDF